MGTANEELEARVAALERQVDLLRQMIWRLMAPPKETSAEAGARMMREAEKNQAELTAAWTKLMEKMGISGEPIGAEALQEMMVREGIRPEDNEFSRGIIEMREE